VHIHKDGIIRLVNWPLWSDRREWQLATDLVVVSWTATAAWAEDVLVGETLDYAFPHSAANEARRLELFQQRLDPLTIRRVERLGVCTGAVCLETRR
jgi:hypothetical protein